MSKPTLREAAAGIGGALLMLAFMAGAQILDANDRQREAEQLRIAAAEDGFSEGLNRLRCVAGMRYDVAVGEFVDVAVTMGNK
jgi:hypothetical protein